MRGPKQTSPTSSHSLDELPGSLNFFSFLMHLFSTSNRPLLTSYRPHHSSPVTGRTTHHQLPAAPLITSYRPHHSSTECLWLRRKNQEKAETSTFQKNRLFLQGLVKSYWRHNSVNLTSSHKDVIEFFVSNTGAFNNSLYRTFSLEPLFLIK